MQIREALRLVRSARFAEAKVPLVCSFEPAHLKTYLQAVLVERFSESTPEVVTFGFDQLREGLKATSSTLKIYPVLLCLSWEDLHPALSWRGRGKNLVEASALAEHGTQLRIELDQWIRARQGAETYFALPPTQYLPLLDSCSSMVMGKSHVEASALMWELARELTRSGARLIDLSPCELDFRELLLSGCPLSPERSEGIARQFVRLAFPQRIRKKALVIDLDGTLWEGVIGEDGPAEVHCQPDGKGFTFYVFQEFLLKLKREGVLLAFCSKNNGTDVLPIFDTLDMPLKLSDFAAHRCNWEPKSRNLASIAKELNIGTDAMVVVDDDPVELAEIVMQCPEVVALRTPREGQAWRELFVSLQDLFAAWHVSQEDRIRSETFADERRRASYAAGLMERERLSVERAHVDHLRDMELEVIVQPDAFPEPRSLELVNKTNQFNLTGERFASHEWAACAAKSGAFCLSAKLRDRFGEFGTVCVAMGHLEERAAHLRQFVLSCRAFGRGVETIVLAEIARQSGCEWLSGPFFDTGRNEPAKRFLASLDCRVEPGDEWRISSQQALKAGENFVREANVAVRTAPVASRRSTG
jgi:FkbH-like protein